MRNLSMFATSALFFALSSALGGCETTTPVEPAPPPTVTTKPAVTARPAPTPSRPAEPPPTGPLYNPDEAKEKAPDKFKVKFVTTKGDFVIEAVRAWSPNGVDRFYNLVKIGFYQDVALFRVVKGFVVQFGLHGDPRVAQEWKSATIEDDKVVESNTRGFVTYAKAGPHTRSTQLFINYGDNSKLDQDGFSPIGKVVEGMEVVDKFYSGYGERTTGKQRQIIFYGNKYLKDEFPELDYIKSASIIP